MGNKKAPKQVASNISAASNPGAPSIAHTNNQSSILKSSFAPHRLGSPLFASVIQGIDSPHIRIHDTTNGRLCSEHATTEGTVISCLDWGYLGKNDTRIDQNKSSKKRKRSSLSNGISSAADIVLAYGTSWSEIHLYSLTESKILKTLKGAHSGGIQDFKFERDSHDNRAYSVDGDGKVVQWDITSEAAIMTTVYPGGLATALRPAASKVICALHSAYIMDQKSMTWSNPYNVSTSNVHTVLIRNSTPSQHLQFISVARTDHFMNVFDEDSFVLTGSLRTENEVLAADLWSSDDHSEGEHREPANQVSQPKQTTLVVLNKDGVLEIFPEPFDFDIESSTARNGKLKTRMKQRSRKSIAQVKIVRPQQVSAHIPLINASFHDNEIAMAWVEGGVNVIFDTLQWRDAETGKMLINGTVEIVKEKSGTGVRALDMNGVKDMGRNYVDDSRAVVINAMNADEISMDEADPEIINISSAEEDDESEDDESEDDESEDDEPITRPTALEDGFEEENEDEVEEKRRDQDDSEDESMIDAAHEDEIQEDAEPPSFGDLMHANAPEAINVSDALADENTQSLIPTNTTSLGSLPPGMSLGTVLTQSLRTNDTSLLETCLHTRDLSTIRSTIERLDSTFATDLLQRLAERLHSRPGRAGSLMVWIQWTLVAHGGYLASQPEVMRKLKRLHMVVRDRAGSLQSLLNLKGKLDMLEAQMNLRRSVLARGTRAKVQGNDEEVVIYVEGQEAEDEDSGEEEDSNEGEKPNLIDIQQNRSMSTDPEDGDERHIDHVRSNINGVSADAEDISDSEEDGMAGDEPSETDTDSEEELDNEDVDHASVDTESSDGEASPPPTQATAGLSNGLG